jgi:DNA helicase-2/ATP-dependent DNA helicase PcrA
VDSPEVGSNQIASKMNCDTGLRIGENVHHAKFGDGVIVNIEGSGTQARAQFNFGRNGMKLLDLGIAKLDRLP